MPIQAPMLPPDEMAKAQATAGINPAQFLIAAAQMHAGGQLSEPSGPPTPGLGQPAKRPRKHIPDIKVVR